jgi:hypothetical protein
MTYAGVVLIVVTFFVGVDVPEVAVQTFDRSFADCRKMTEDANRLEELNGTKPTVVDGKTVRKIVQACDMGQGLQKQQLTERYLLWRR